VPKQNQAILKTLGQFGTGSQCPHLQSHMFSMAHDEESSQHRWRRAGGFGGCPASAIDVQEGVDHLNIKLCHDVSN